MRKLTREQAVEAFGEELVRTVETSPCELTGRLIYAAFEPEHAGMDEWMTQVSGSPLQAAFYTRPEDELDISCGIYDWTVDHFEDIETF